MARKDEQRSKYIVELEKSLKELKIEKQEIATLLNKSDKTITRYFSEDTPIKPAYREKIDKYVEERTIYGNYEHRPSKVFSKLIDRLLKEFKDEITQNEFAQLTWLSNQSQVSKTTTGVKMLSAKEQYDILSIFLRLCTNQKADMSRGFNAADVFSKHYDTAKELYLMLHGNTESFEMFEKYKDNEFSNFVIKLTLINYFITLPYKAQELILDCPSAFFDSLQILYYDKFIDYDRIDGSSLYPSAHRFMDRFNSMPANRRIAFQQLLEKMAADQGVFSYYDQRDNWELFDMVTQYRKMIRSARDRGIGDTTETCIRFGRRIDGFVPNYNYSIEDMKDKDKDISFDKDKQIRRFEAVIHDLIDFDRTSYTVNELTDMIIDDIEYRLTMCPYEWHIWMLYASYVFAYQEDDSISELMDTIMSIPNVSDITGFPDIQIDEEDVTKFTDIFNDNK